MHLSRSQWIYGVNEKIQEPIKYDRKSVPTGESRLIRVWMIRIPAQFKVYWKSYSCLSCVKLHAYFEIQFVQTFLTLSFFRIKWEVPVPTGTFFQLLQSSVGMLLQCVCVCACVRVCMCVCDKKEGRERERKRETRSGGSSFFWSWLPTAGISLCEHIVSDSWILTMIHCPDFLLIIAVISNKQTWICSSCLRGLMTLITTHEPSCLISIAAGHKSHLQLKIEPDLKDWMTDCDPPFDEVRAACSWSLLPG